MRYGWKLDRATWQRAFELTARPWRHVPFHELHANMVPDEPGIYAVCGRPKHPAAAAGIFVDLYNALYVGKSGTLHHRFLQHCRNPKPEIVRVRECFPAAQFWFLPLAHDEIASAEDALIDCLGPPANLRRGLRATVGEPRAL